MPGGITCDMETRLGYPAMWVNGSGIRGYKVLRIDRVSYLGERQEVRGANGVHFTNDRTYKEVRDHEPDGTTDLAPQTYQRVKDAYPPPEYATLLYVDTPTRKFSVLDVEAPYGTGFHYEVTVQLDPDDPTDTAVYKTDSPCTFDLPPSVFGTSVPCSPIVLSDPLISNSGEWVGLLSIDPLSYPGRRELFDVIGRRTPVAYSQVRQTARTTMRVLTRTLAERQSFLDLLSSGRILLLRNPDRRYPENDWYISVGEVTEERIFTDHRRPERRFVLEIAVVDRPAGYLDIVSSRTFDQARDYLPDGVTGAPAGYSFDDWTGTDGYRNFFDVEIGQESFSPQADSIGTRHYVYGEGIYPTKTAAVTSWSLI